MYPKQVLQLNGRLYWLSATAVAAAGAKEPLLKCLRQRSHLYMPGPSAPAAEACTPTPSARAPKPPELAGPPPGKAVITDEPKRKDGDDWQQWHGQWNRRSWDWGSGS